MKPCERCGKTPGPSPYAMHDYCDHCSRDLCEKCMNEGKCPDSHDERHHPADDEERA